MASRLLLRPLRPFALTALLTTTPFVLAPHLRQPLRCDARTTSSPLQSCGKEARTPVYSGERWNEGALRQVSSGSLLGESLTLPKQQEVGWWIDAYGRREWDELLMCGQDLVRACW
jgi:hypothetical protein